MSFSLSDRLPGYTRFADVPPNYDPDQALADFNALTPEEQKRLANGIAIAASSQEADQEFKAASVSAAVAVDTIETLFVTLTAKLISLGDAQEFVRVFTGIKETFRQVVKDSHGLAVTIAQYATSFDDVIIKFCADTSISIEQRIIIINGFIEKSEGIKKSAEDMDTQFKDLKDAFAEFTGSFSTWAKDKEAEDEQSIKDLYADIARLDKLIGEIDAAILAVASNLAATLPVTAILVAFFPPAAPFIIGGGLIIAGLEVGTLTGLVIARNVLVKDKRDDEDKIKDLQDEIGKIKATRTQLEQVGQAALLTFATNVSAIQKIWTTVVSDAILIKGWLLDGAQFAHHPAYMKDQLEYGVEAYKSMGVYLKNYADGVTEFVERK